MGNVFTPESGGFRELSGPGVEGAAKTEVTSTVRSNNYHRQMSAVTMMKKTTLDRKKSQWT